MLQNNLWRSTYITHMLQIFEGNKRNPQVPVLWEKQQHNNNFGHDMPFICTLKLSLEIILLSMYLYELCK